MTFREAKLSGSHRRWLGDLTGAEIPHGVGLFNLGRQMGGLIGVAFLTTFLEHHMALSRTALVAHLGSENWVLEQAQYEIVRELSGPNCGMLVMSAASRQFSSQIGRIFVSFVTVNLHLAPGPLRWFVGLEENGVKHRHDNHC